MSRVDQRVRFCGTTETVRNMGTRRTIAPGDSGRVIAEGELLGIWTMVVQMDGGPMVAGIPQNFEPLIPSGAAPSTYESLHDLLRVLRSSTCARDGSA